MYITIKYLCNNCFHENGFFSVHSFEEHYLSILKYTGTMPFTFVYQAADICTYIYALSKLRQNAAISTVRYTNLNDIVAGGTVFRKHTVSLFCRMKALFVLAIQGYWNAAARHDLKNPNENVFQETVNADSLTLKE